ncbi:WD40 repeat-like protein [Schizopora paradoxa]|uniref:WD40 repeat-like protein n=1 Tax=Schizopora paradoxa TaxID=27342 RepID=A0A0H2SQC9_9AGAM|nr:WD40 repeat-like protein [Schizopora paradoxa]
MKSSASKKSNVSTSNGQATSSPTLTENKEDAIPKLDKGKMKAHPTELQDDDEKNGSMTLPKTFTVVAGSYEKLLYGLEGSLSYEEGEPSTLKGTLKPLFIFPAHVSGVKSVAGSPSGGKWLASGSTDEIIKVWDLRRRKEIGGLMQHQGSITHLSFPTRSHLVSASEDGTICIFRARDWVLLRTLKGHKGRINSVAIHPSGKVGLSVGKDNALRMWDLMRGKGSASTKLGKEGELVRWSLKGDCFVIQSGKSLDIYTTDMALQRTITHSSRVHDLCFCKRADDGDKEVLLVAGEDKKVVIYDMSGGDETTLPVVGSLVGHQNRVKAVDIITVALPSFTPPTPVSSTTLACTISSDGWIRVFDLAPILSSKADNVIELQAIATYDTKGSRLTCLTVADGELVNNNKSKNGKRKRADEDGDPEDTGDAWVGFDEDVSPKEDD